MQILYAIYYTGASGSGMGMLMLGNGRVDGADVSGGVFSGQYTENSSGDLVGSISIMIPDGGTLVTGEVDGGIPTQFDIPFSIPKNAEEYDHVEVHSPFGPMNVRFKKLKEL